MSRAVSVGGAQRMMAKNGLPCLVPTALLPCSLFSYWPPRPAKQEVRMPLLRTHLWNEANKNKRLQESHLQVDHEFNESLAVMHFVHGYGLCRSRRRNHRSQCSTIWVLNASYLDMWVYPKTNQLLLQTALKMTVRKNDCSTNCNGTQIMYFCHNWQALLEKNSSVQGFTQGQT